MVTGTQLLKLHILAEGITVTPEAARALAVINEGRPLTPADYPSTSGLILQLDDDVWVNAPIAEFNPNFVDATTPTVLDHTDAGLMVRRGDEQSPARFWRPPAYHGTLGSAGKPLNYYTFTHGDRVRLSPMQGCGMVCKFCNIPYEVKYATKPIDSLIEAVEVALADPVQPAHHMLISGGTPKPADYEFLRSVYRTMLERFTDIDIDIMMVPAEGLLDVAELADLGVHELSINIEIVNPDIARSLMRQKLQRGLDYYLEFIEGAAGILGPGKVRSMLMVGLEPLEDTLRGVELIIDAGGVPVLSPFRPDPTTPLADYRPPDATELEAAYVGASEIVHRRGVALGPSCPPCTHNTLNFCDAPAHYLYEPPRMVS